MASITYSDGTTAPAGYTYDRLGRLSTASGGGSARALTYQGNTNLVTSENSTAGPLAELSVNTGYDALLRRNSLEVVRGGASLVNQSFGFDAASRLVSAAQGTASAEYGYWPNSASGLVHTITFKNSGTPVMTTSKEYDALDRLTSTATTATDSATTVSGFSYTYNAANQRVRADLAPDGTHWLYGYDALGQVTSASRQWSDNTLVRGEQYGYAYDQIGNRIQSKTNGRQSSSTANRLNEYSQRTVPGAVNVTGKALPEAIISINGREASRQQGGYFYGSVDVDNSQVAVDAAVDISANKTDTVSNMQAGQQGHVFVPKTPEQYSYDQDSNLTKDGHWNYGWDGENRLVSMEAITELPFLKRTKLTFDYDDTGRRIQKQVWERGLSDSAYHNVSLIHFVYDGEILVAECAGTNLTTSLRSYLWGIDLSASRQGAGGTGGLLIFTNGDTTNLTAEAYIPSLDGGGNVVAITKSAEPNSSAHYEYGAFGELIRKYGNASANMPVLWSTKYCDLESNLTYYGCRYYSSDAGRWLSRDLIEEGGGTNALAYCRNDSVNYADINGLQIFLEIPPPLLDPLLTGGAESAGPFIRPGVGVDGPPAMGPSMNPLFQPQMPFVLHPLGNSGEPPNSGTRGGKKPESNNGGSIHATICNNRVAERVWSQYYPLTKSKGIKLLRLVQSALSRSQMDIITNVPFQKALKFISSAPSSGVGPRNYPFYKAGGQDQRNRVDIEVNAGKAFVDDPAPAPPEPPRPPVPTRPFNPYFGA